MNLVSVSVGRPREVDRAGRSVLTSIWKTPVLGRVHVRTLNLDGDEQSDPSVHGGREKAVYAYPSEHYSIWRHELGVVDLPWASFGENLTTRGLVEDDVRIGDRLRIGSAEFIVTQPRLPCFKLGLRLGRDDIIQRFFESDRSGFYLAVTREGDVEAGDSVTVLERDRHGVTVADVVALRNGHVEDPDLMRRAIAVPALPAGWREHFQKRLAVAGE